MIRKIFRRKKPRIGLVLSGGSARGLAHIGVLKELEKNGITPDIIAGNSMGGIIGALYAKNLDIKSVEDYINNFKLKDFIKFFDISITGGGIIKGENFKEFIDDYLQGASFEDLKIPLLVNATDLDEGKEIVFDKGKVSDAIRSTISLPGILKPVNHKRKTLLDGTLINPLPINLLKKYKLDIIICSNVLSRFHDKKAKGINDILRRSFVIMSDEIIRLRLKDHKYDFLIEPDISKFEFYDFLKRRDIIKAGEKATRKQIEDILKKIKP